MKGLFGLLGLLVVLALVAMLGKRHLQAAREVAVPQSMSMPAPAGNVREQSQQIQNQFKQQLESAMQQRPADGTAESP